MRYATKNGRSNGHSLEIAKHHMAARRKSTSGGGGGSGLGLGAKCGLVVGVTTGLSLAVLAMLASSNIAKITKEAAESRGYALAIAIAAPGADGWFVEKESDNESKTFTRRGASTRLRDLLDHGALSAWIAGPNSVSLRLHKDEFKSSKSGGQRGKAQYVTGSWLGRDVRVFQARLKDKNDQPVGVANVMFAESAFEASGGVLFWLLALVGAAAGVGAGFFASSLYTNPLRDLAQSVSRLSRGNLNYRSQHRGNDELGRLSRALETMCDTLAEGEEAQERLGMIARENELLGELQSAMQPEHVPSTEGFEAVAVQLRGADSGSDLYDAVPLDGGKLALFVASTSARGALGALLAGMTRAYLRSALERDGDVGEALRATNRNLAGGMRKGMHVTCQVAVLDPSKGQATVYIAGHRAPFYACRGGEVSVVHGEGLALGLDAGPVFDRRLEEVIVDMPQGTRIVLTTLGTYDFDTASGEAFGVERFQELVRKQAPKNSQAFLNLVLGALDIELGDEERVSDATIVTAKRML